MKEYAPAILKFHCDSCGVTTDPAYDEGIPSSWAYVKISYNTNNITLHLCDVCTRQTRRFNLIELLQNDTSSFYRLVGEHE